MVKRHNAAFLDTNRQENVAEHSYTLATLACGLADSLNSSLERPLDVGKLAQFGLVHDLPEVYMAQDISVYDSQAAIDKKPQYEKVALQQIRQETETLPWVVQTVEEYERQETEESRFIYALDKLIVHMIVLSNDTHHAQPTRERYLETEEVAREKISRSFPGLLPYFNDLCDMFRERPHFFSD